MTCSPCVEINNVSRQLGESPTKIAFTPQWPYGRYTYPEGGRFIREYGRSAPLPEALTELQLSAVPVAAPTVTGRAYTAIGGKVAPYWGVPEMIEEARAERGPSPPYERAYLAELGRPRYGSLTVESRILAVRAPTSVRTDQQFKIEVDIETVGTGSNKQFLAIYDVTAAKYIGAGKSDDPLPPGQHGMWTATINPLNDWYTELTGIPIPSTLRWIARVGYVTLENPDGSWEGYITDERDIPAISTTGAPPTLCEQITTESECLATGCYWYNNSCHSSPQSFLDKYKYYFLAAGAFGMVGLVVIARR